MQVSTVDKIADFVGTSAGTHVDTGLWCVFADELAIVVVIGIHVFAYQLLLRIVGRIGIQACQRIFILFDNVVGIKDRQFVVLQGFIPQGHIFPGIQTFRLAGQAGEGLLGHHVEFGFAIGTSLGGNDDNPVGTA